MVEVFVHRVDRKRHGGIRRGRKHIRLATHLNNIRRMSAARALRMKGVDRPPGKRLDAIFNKSGFIQCVGVNGDLHIVSLGHIKTGRDRSRCRSPIFMKLQSNCAGFNLFVQPIRQ